MGFARASGGTGEQICEEKLRNIEFVLRIYLWNGFELSETSVVVDLNFLGRSLKC